LRTPTETEIRRRLAKRVSALRREKKWTQQLLADRAGLPRSYVADLEGARRNPSLHTLVRLANALGAPLACFFSDEA
jgi:XRE family transcriptional regulator, regulator of sulfur utilization